jgi:parvulin-like peptidyl-prolyl isomerase
VQNRVKYLIAFVFLACISISFAACNRSGSGGGGTNPDTAVAATVNGRNIMLTEVERSLNQMAQGRQSQMSPVELNAARLRVLQSLIQEQVLFQRAERDRLLPSDDEITQGVNAFKQQRRMTEEEYQRFLQQSGQTEQAFRETVRRELAMQKLQERVVGQIQISDREVEEAYNTNRAQFVNPRGVMLAVIVVDPRPNEGIQNDARTEADAQQKIQNIQQELRAGRDFATIARQQSEDMSLIRGGEIGFATEEQLRQGGFPPELISQFFGQMQLGSYTDSVRSSDGRFTIFKLLDRRLEAQPRTLEDAREEIKQALIEQRRALLGEALVAVAMSEARIVNNLAQNMINSPSNLGGLRPAAPQQGGVVASPTPPAMSPAATAPTQSPAATTGSPAGGVTTTTPSRAPATSPTASPRR